ncbi:MAG: Coq4 family protein [Candidatus Binatia bacterium]|nr:Coq4 family protein [Candidatus Binatia bacterium]
MGRSQWIRPLDAVSALRRIWQDPENTGPVLELYDALDGPFEEGWFRRFRASRVGQRVVDEERDLLSVLVDRTWLAKMPDGSLGRVYLDFVEREDLSAEALVEASGATEDLGDEPWADEGRARFFARRRDQHDLEHVVAGYDCDLRGETALLAFCLGQVTSLATGVLIALGLIGLDAEGRRFVWASYQRGRRAAWLPATDWENLLALPLDDVRLLLGLGESPMHGRVRGDHPSVAA